MISRKLVFLIPVAVIVAALLIGGLGVHFDWWHAPVEKLPALHGRSLASVIAQLGPPDKQSEYAMGEVTIDEFRVELHNVYRPDNPATARVRINELQWDHDRYHVTAWLHQVNDDWVVLDSCRWKQGVVF